MKKTITGRKSPYARGAIRAALYPPGFHRRQVKKKRIQATEAGL